MFFVVERCSTMRTATAMDNWWLAAPSWQHAHLGMSFLQSFLEKHQLTQVIQPSYSPDLVPCDFWLFPKLKSPLRGTRFHPIDEIQENMVGKLMETP